MVDRSSAVLHWIAQEFVALEEFALQPFQSLAFFLSGYGVLLLQKLL
jgi:hypothetical protein